MNSQAVLLGVLAVFSFWDVCYSACPKIIRRSEWGAKKPKSVTPIKLPAVPFAIIHHGGDQKYCLTKTKCMEVMREYQTMHMAKGWSDIGYNFVVGEDGNVYEGRGWNVTGSHAPNFNSKSIGICVPGDFTKKTPNKKAQDSVKSLIACSVEKGYVTGSYTLLGHRQTKATKCPGDEYYKEIKSWPHWKPLAV